MDLTQKIRRNGFERIIGNDASGYILLTESTDGRSGRKIFINASLVPKFRALVEDSRDDYILSRLSQLKALAGSGSAFSNQQDPKQHKTQCGDLLVSYTLLPSRVKTAEAGVYITDLDYGLFGRSNQPGAYRVTGGQGRWIVESGPSSDIDTVNAAINGPAEDIRKAATKIMPGMVTWAYGQSGLNERLLEDQGYTLFYNPQSIRIDGETWKTPEQKNSNRRVTAAKLATALRQAQQRGRPVQWTIHGNGCALLQDALAQLQGQDLSQHQLMFMAPSGALEQTLRLAQDAKMSLHSEVMKYSELEKSSSRLRNQYTHSDQVAQAVRQFGKKYKDRANEIAGEGRHTSLKTAWGLAQKAAALLTSPVTLALKVSNPFELREDIDTLRNNLASGLQVEDPTLNPHFHPHLSKTAFNQMVKEKSGGLGKSYGVTFRALLKKFGA